MKWPINLAIGLLLLFIGVSFWYPKMNMVNKIIYFLMAAWMIFLFILFFYQKRKRR
jgi:putative effector of murein hydrolase LrgA (UPF0299 family)